MPDLCVYVRIRHFVFNMERLKLNNWLIIAGNGRNVGKTWLSEYCIKQLASSHKVISLKIASHMHQLSDDIKYLAGDITNWMLGEECNPSSKKDSGRMLTAGANTAYYAQLCSDKHLPQIIDYIRTTHETDQPIVCESAAIGQFGIPGLAFYIEDKNNINKTHNWDFSFHGLYSEKSEITNLPKEVLWDKSNWIIK